MNNPKFRAWLKDLKCMTETIWTIKWEGDALNPKIKKIVATPEIDLFGVYEYDIEDIELMQYTGVKDLNGLEICEGDIVMGLPHHYISEVIGTVKYGGLSYAFVGKTKNGDKWFDTITNQKLQKADVEVIGNIYEDKELLK